MEKSRIVKLVSSLLFFFKNIFLINFIEKTKENKK